MKTISNEDYAKAKRLLRVLGGMPATGLREIEDRRQARLLLRKWEKREKRSTAASKSKDDKSY